MPTYKKKSILKRIPVRSEPYLKAHRYIVLVHAGKKEVRKYLSNREEVRAVGRGLKRGQIMEVFSASHSHVGSFAR